MDLQWTFQTIVAKGDILLCSNIHVSILARSLRVLTTLTVKAFVNTQQLKIVSGKVGNIMEKGGNAGSDH